MLNLIPTPKKCTVNDEALHAVPATVYTESPLFGDALVTFCESIKRIYDIEMTTTPDAGVSLVLDEALAADTYTLDSTERVIIRAATREGALYGLATALQLLEKGNGALAVPSVSIEDKPDKDYRSFMIATGRIFHPLSKMLKYVDLCFYYKVKYLHLHFADADLYTMPSKAFPKLCKPGKHYTFEEIAKLNDYAASRGVVLVPELEGPGHARVLTEAYPEIFGNYTDESRTEPVGVTGSKFSAHGVICVGHEQTFEAVKTLIGEIIEMFPSSPYIHIGGDEAPYDTWDLCATCRAYMEKNGIKDVHELYGEYVGRVASYVLSIGKTPIVWEGVAKEALRYIPKETIMVAWSGKYQLATDHLELGFKIINASWKPLYLVTRYIPNYDHYSYEDILNWNVYNWQHWAPTVPVCQNPLTIEPTDKLLGAAFCAWSMEYEQLISRLLECMPAFAERAWNADPTLQLEEYCLMMRKSADKPARLIADK
ncbi:MAG: family 20 glycosylhydrolase [Clostridia bacterium]|nr:family 20 glycosylhydrolase [Clostridia bacterium]